MEAIAEKPDQRPKKRDGAPSVPRSLLDLTEAALKGLSLVVSDAEIEGDTFTAVASEESG
eukprot:CAMPEP_0114150294 /NCGR_PEP_ID=MMETSP0043_2-20121206/22628_1 /TAXON_ID=464988 /ORGANISM="Hemiselmis andersenii, Strain CCMP644" /LENGTH=59 /DNA_ID=CAMNT_0001245019 /DNA_START=14 /DNA_END=190 /DNA_ORIENTATION=+